MRRTGRIEYDASGGLDEGGHFRRIFPTGRRLDPAGDIDHPGANTSDLGCDVFGCQAPSEDQPGQGGNVIENVGGHGRAGAAGLTGDISVNQDRVGHAANRLRTSQILDHPGPVRRLAQSKGSDEPKMTERNKVFRRLATVQLNDFQSKVAGDLSHRRGGSVNEDAHRGHRRRQSVHDLSGAC